MKKKITLVLALVLVISLLAGCGSSKKEPTKIRVGATPVPHAEVLEVAKELLAKEGYDLELTRTIADNVGVPVIASGGAGTKQHFYEALTQGGADAALAASLFHFKELEISEVKEYLRDKGVPVRI